MGRFDQGVETQFLCHFTWCIARLVAPVKKLFIFANNCSKQALSVGLETGLCGCIEA